MSQGRTLIRYSDDVLAVMLILAESQHIGAAQKLVDVREKFVSVPPLHVFSD